MVKYGGTHDFMNIEVICFLNVCNVDKFLSHHERFVMYSIPNHMVRATQ